MENAAFPKGQRVTSPDGPGDVTEVIGEKVIIKLENGETRTYAVDDIEDNSSAG